MSTVVHDGIWRVPFYVVRVLDADTVRGDADLGFGTWRLSWAAGRERKPPLDIRINGLYSPERGTPEGEAAYAWALTVLPVGLKLTLHSIFKLTFARYVGDLYFDDGTLYADACVLAGHGTRAA